MKKLLLGCIVLTGGLHVLGQGKVGFSNDSLHLVYWNPNPLFSPPGLAGQVFNPTNAPGTFVADLYMGTTSASLSLYSTTVFSFLTPGRWVPENVVVPSIPGGTTVYAVVQVRDQFFPAASTWTPGTSFPPLGGTYFGYSEEFSFTLGSSITYPPLGGLSGNWPPGNYPLPPYGYGAIMMTTIPEPGVIGLAVASVAGVVLCRRKV